MSIAEARVRRSEPAPLSRITRRAESVRLNDIAIRDAVIAFTAEAGWDAVTMSGVAKRAGLTVGAVYARAESVAELAIDVWTDRLHDWFIRRMTDLYDAQLSGDGVAVQAAFAAWDNEPLMSNAVVELLLASIFDDELAEVVGADVSMLLNEFCVPGSISEHLAAARMLCTAFLFGHVLALRAVGVPPSFDIGPANNLAAFPGAKTQRLDREPQPLVWERDLSHLDPHDATLIRATAEVVSRVGYRRATFARIARAAGMTRGSVTGRYPDKASLVAAAGFHMLIPPGEVWSQYAAVEAECGPRESRALFLESFLEPANRPRWAFNLELARMAASVPELAAFAVSDDVLEQTHLGVMLVAAFLPDVHTLPYMGPFSAGINT